MIESIFEVEGVLEARGRRYVFARSLETRDFSVTASSTLGGQKVEPWLEIPKAWDRQSRQREDLFVFLLSPEADPAVFAEGVRVTFKSSASH